MNESDFFADDSENQKPERTRSYTSFDYLNGVPLPDMPVPTAAEIVRNFRPPSEEVRSIDAWRVSEPCSGPTDPKLFALIWMLQQRSMEPAGLQRLACELVAMFPSRLNRETLSFPFHGCLIVQLANHLENCCRTSRCDCYDWQLSIWDGQLQDDLTAFRAAFIERAQTTFHRTVVTQKVFAALDHALACPGIMTIAFGAAGVGKTEMARRWCDIHAGVARYVEVPGVANARAFYAAIAEQLGVEVGKSYNPEIISLRVIDVLKRNRLMLVLDEAHRLWPVHNRPTASPLRIIWLTSLVNAGVPLGMVCMPEFFKRKQIFVEFTDWSCEQFDRRLDMIQALPARLCQDDLRGVARHLLPKGNKASHELLVTYAEASKTGLSAITGTLNVARELAKKAARCEPTQADIQAAIRDVRAPMDCILAADPDQLAASTDFPASAKPRRRMLGKTRAKRVQTVCIPPAAIEAAEDFSCAEREVLPSQVHRRTVAPSPAAR